MAQSIEVLVKDKETGNEFTLTYKAFLDTQSRFILLGEFANGQLVEGDPNLNPQHRRPPSVKSAVVADVGKIEKPQIIEAPAEPVAKVEEPKIIQEEPREKRKYTKRVKETA